MFPFISRLLRACSKRGLTLSGNDNNALKSFCLQRVRPLFGQAQTKHSRNRIPALRRRPQLETLDPRLMFSVTPLPLAHFATLANTGTFAPMSQQQIDQQMGLPMLDSLPGAPATIYLDFDGNFLNSWSTSGQTFTNVSTPVWDMDGNKTNFNAAEQAVIKEVWARVAEDYAPFNINVSTDYYGSFDNGKALQVAIGGDNNDWLHLNASGISSIGSFQDDQPNIVFAFDLVAWAKAGVKDGEGRSMNGPGALANTITHEAGHSFGLLHHSTYDAQRRLVDEYDPGSSNWTPIMGNNLADDRTTWAFLPSDQGANLWQDDMAVIGGTTNGFGFRGDDHGNTLATADPLVRQGTAYSILNPLTGKGIINQPNDKDFFKFTAPGGAVQIVVNAAKFGPNLLPYIQLWSASGKVANATFASPTKSIINVANLPVGGTYYVMVRSLGDYGDVGQYTVSVSNVLTAVQMSYVNMTAYTALQPRTTTTIASQSILAAKSSLTNAGSGQGVSFRATTQQNWIVNSALPIAVVKPIVPSTAATATTQHLHNPLRPELVDAVFSLELF